MCARRVAPPDDLRDFSNPCHLAALDATPDDHLVTDRISHTGDERDGFRGSHRGMRSAVMTDFHDLRIRDPEVHRHDVRVPRALQLAKPLVCGEVVPRDRRGVHA